MFYNTGIFVTIYLGVLTIVAGVSHNKIQIRRGEPATLMCYFQDIDARESIRWKSKDGLLTSGLVVYKHPSNLEVQKPTQHDWNLIIKKVDDTFAGEYTCETSNEKVIARYLLEIVDAPRIIPERSSAFHEEFQEGSTREMKCYFSGVPTPKVRWYRGSMDAVDTRITGEILRLPDVTRYASDTYICEGENDVGSLNYTIDLQVNFPVEVDVMNEVILASVGDQPSLVCVVQGQPIKPISAYWADKNGIRIETAWQFIVTTEQEEGIPVKFITATFKAGTLGKHDFGNYTCVGAGNNGEAKKVTQLVERQPWA
ncbi:neurotrimin-like [Dreissena polymorpha]|uniref:Ig-like domain-containing protein n=1 Tax=Dreissena polymorpha TaxID=45954 RepID=A0A9D4FE31_DREPO|nr:neurotrimin-like [Dreissena polymorpha]KAH3794117.1 hypothetical protein DPMN_147648 [Dreissena polymorpha]